jgi:hypothetical protein
VVEAAPVIEAKPVAVEAAPVVESKPQVVEATPVVETKPVASESAPVVEAARPLKPRRSSRLRRSPNSRSLRWRSKPHRSKLPPRR